MISVDTWSGCANNDNSSQLYQCEICQEKFDRCAKLKCYLNELKKIQSSELNHCTNHNVVLVWWTQKNTLMGLNRKFLKEDYLVFSLDRCWVMNSDGHFAFKKLF